MSILFKRALATASESVSQLVDVLIVGGGPAGLTLSAALKNSPITRDLKVALVEGFDLSAVKTYPETHFENFTNRVSSLTPQSIEYLEKIGSWKFVDQAKIQPYDQIIVTEGISDARLDFGMPSMATMCENINLQSSLYQRIKELETEGNSSSVEIIDKTRVTAITNDPLNNWPIVHLSNDRSIKTRLLVGADGFNSPVRKFSGIESRGWFYERFGVVATMKLKHPPFTSTAYQRFLPTGPIAMLPLPDGYATLVWSQSIENSKLLTEVDEVLFKNLVNAAFILGDEDLQYYYKTIKNGNTQGLNNDIEWRIEHATQRFSEEQLEEKFPGEVVSVSSNSRARFPLRLSHADTYVGERIALVGDAAHTTHPLAGQGLNMGQGDVQALVKALEIGVKRGLDIGNPLVLEPYWADRYPENNLLLGVVDKLHKLYSTKLEPFVTLRSIGVNLLNDFGFLKDAMVKRVSGK